MRVVILGLGQYPKGSGVSAALYFARRGDDVIVIDFYYSSAMDANVQRLKKYKNVSFILGKRALDEIRSADLLVRHQRIRIDEPELVEAQKLGIPIESELSLFLRECPAQVIGITGTRGKSTTTAFVHQMLELGSKNHELRFDDESRIKNGRCKTQKKVVSHVWLGGNILISPLTFLHKIKKEDLVVLEMSSFQLEGTGASGISPQIAVWTNLMRDHLNTYPSIAEYTEAKAQIFRHQKPNDIVFLPSDKAFDMYAKETSSRVYRFGKKDSEESRIVSDVSLKLLGEHNIKNAQIAVAIARHMGVSVVTIKKVLRSFKGLPNRLEEVGVKKGVRYVNDSAATTPDGTMAAIEALHDRRIHLIFGGADKELVFDEVANELKRFNVDVALLPGTAHKKIVHAFRKEKVSYEDVPDLKSALCALRSRAKKGDIILLSSGCASFGLFKNEFDRGEQFRKTVSHIK